MSLRKKIAITLGMLAALLLFLAFGLPPIVRAVAQKKLTELLSRRTTISEVAFNPFSLELIVRGVNVEEKEGSGTFFSLGEARVNLEAASLYRLAPVLSEVRMVGPKVSIVRIGDNRYNFSDLLERPADETQAPKEKGEPTHFFVGNLSVSDGGVRFDNRPDGKIHEVSGLELFIPVVSNLPIYVEEFSEPKLSLVFDGSPLRLAGRTKPFTDSLETLFSLDLKDLDLAKYASYSPVKTGVELTSAKLDLELSISYLQARERAPSVTLSGVTALREVSIREENGAPLFSLTRLKVEIAPSEVTARKLTLKEVSLEKPAVSVRRDREGRVNLMSLGSKATTRATQERADGEEEKASMAVRVERISLRDGRVDFTDERAWKPFRTVLSGLSVGVEGLDLAAKTFKAFSLEFATEAGERVRAGASGSFDPLELSADWDVSDLLLPKYSPYYGERLNFEVAGGHLSTSGTCRLSGVEKIVVEGGKASLSGLSLKRGSEKPFLTLPELAVVGVAADLENRRATVESVSIRGLAATVVRMEDGALSVAELVKPSPQPTQPQERAAGGPEWIFYVKELALKRWDLAFEDRNVSPPTRLAVTGLNARLSGLSNESGKPAALSLEAGLMEKGRLSLEGTVGIAPTQAELAVKLKDLELVRFNPYLADLVRLTLVDGELNVDGAFSYSLSPDGGNRAGYRGGLALVRFKAVDEAAQELVSWGSLAVNGVSFTSEPRKVSIESVSFTDPYARVTIMPDGTLNLTALKAGQKPGEAAGEASEPPKSEGGEKPPEAEEAPQPVEVNAVALKGGTVDFSDRHITPNYRVRLVDLAGRVSRMASEEAGGGEVTVLGSVDGYAPLEITGRLNPFAKSLMVDLKIDFRNVEMSPMTPYSARYLGYKIDRGKLGLALAYRINGVKLDSENKVLFDQLTLGDEVESPDATKLPVRFALALITDKNGVIDLDVPVSGTLDDPEFSYGRLIWKVIVNLLVKAVSSPFALIGSLFGGGPELSYAVFEPASVDLAPAEADKLEKLAKALTERPGLKLEVQGHADPEADRLALRDQAFVKKLKAQKVLENAKLGKPPVAESELTLAPEEYDGLIALAFRQEKIPRAADAARAPTVEEMKKLIITHIEVGDEELRELAAGRARAVINRLTVSPGVDPARVFLTEPKAIKPEPKDGVADARVDFVLH